MDFSSFYKKKRVFVTGHTGFKGSWLSIWLEMMGAEICGYALEPYTDRDNFVLSGLSGKITHHVGDIRDYKRLYSVFDSFKPEIVFHLAAQPIVRRSYTSPKETFDINIGGTVNILECCRLSDSVKVMINVTSDKCYENIETKRGYREDDRLGGHDPYSASKACSEIICSAYIKSFFNPDTYDTHKKCLASVRAGNVIGGGDWQVDRLIPDCIRSLEKKEPVILRNPGSIRPWQHALEPLSGYLLLASKMSDDPERYSRGWNFGPTYTQNLTVGEIAKLIIKEWGSGSIEVLTSDKKSLHEADILNLDISQAQSELNWRPRWNIYKAVSATVEWYKKCIKNSYQLCRNQIMEYMDF